MFAKTKIAVIGAGKLGEALIAGMMDAGVVKKHQFIATAAHRERLDTIQKKFGIKVTLSNGEAVRKANIVLLCVKPQAVEEVLRQIVDDLTPAHVLISVAASVSIRFMENILTKPIPVIRVMPNTPCLIREGMAAVSAGKHATATHLEAAKKMFEALGRCIVLDEKHMEVNPTLQKIADDLAGRETNPVIQARRFFNYVIDKSDHYSKSGPAAKGKCLGDAMECLIGKGDCCTDQHALFIALCRARGIPCRLMYGSRLKPENAGKDHDPGYRCWPNFFAPGIGWVPLDISSADTAPAEKAGDWFGGLDENRMEWAEGRDFDLEPRSNVRPDLVIRGWVEVDGKPHFGLTRVVNFQRQ